MYVIHYHTVWYGNLIFAYNNIRIYIYMLRELIHNIYMHIVTCFGCNDKLVIIPGRLCDVTPPTVSYIT